MALPDSSMDTSSSRVKLLKIFAIYDQIPGREERIVD